MVDRDKLKININCKIEDSMNAEKEFIFFERIASTFGFFCCDIISDGLYVKIINIIEQNNVSFATFSFVTNEDKDYFCICFEYFCFLFNITEKINLIYIKEIINLLLKNRSRLISSNNENYERLKSLFNEEIQFSDETFPSESEKLIIYEEIKQFISSIHSNLLRINNIQASKYAISTYFIRRFYFESETFTNSRFFNFDEKTVNIQSFQENEFINLRGITTNITLAFHKRTCRLVVIKFIEKIVSYEDFQKEENLFSKINQINNAVKYFGYIKNEDNKITKLIIDFMSEGTLQDYISKRKSNKKNLDKYVISYKILKSLYQIHSNAIIHRDLKPNNIFINHDFDFFIGDFDSSRFLFKTTKSETFTKDIGSIQYSSPEMINSQSYTIKTDIYSFGLVLYYIFTEHHPYQNEGDYDIINLKNDQKFDQFKENIPNVFIQNIYSKCVKFDPNERPDSIDLIDDFIKLSFDMYQNKQPNLFYYLMIEEKDLFIQQKITNFYNKILNIYCKPHEISLLMIFIIHNYFNYDALNYINSLVEKKNPKGYLLMGHFHFFVNQSKESILYYKIAAESYNDKFATYLLGIIYLNGTNVEKDLNKAIYYFELGSNQCFDIAQYMLGEIYNTYQYFDISKSIYYYKLAANQNYDLAQLKLGNIYLDKNNGFFNVNKAIYYLTLSSNQLNADAKYILGSIYFDGEIVEEDIEKAFHYFSQASDLNHPNAQLYLGFIYSKHEYGHFNMNKAIHYLTNSANAGIERANYFLACIYYLGNDIPYDIDKSIEFFKKAGDEMPKSIFFLGLIYLKEKHDIEKAIYYLTMASNKNYIEAYSALGSIYFNKAFNHFDINKTIYYYTLAAEYGDSESQLILGLIYLENKDIPRNINQAIKYLDLAEKQNNKSAQAQLGFLYYEGKHITKNINKAIYYFEKAARQNDYFSQFYIGYIYYNGIYVPPDINKAEYYFLLNESNTNNSYAQFYLGMIYFRKNDIIKAIKYFTLSANQKNSHAQLYLGLYYLQKKDIDSSFYYLNRSSMQYNNNANLVLGLIYFTGYYVPKDINKAIYFLNESAKQECKQAMHLIGTIYLYGEYIHQDINKGIYYLNLSSDLMYVDSHVILGELYFNDRIISHNYEKAISYFKKASSFNDCVAKNYLGIIYKNGYGVPRNIFNAIEYFNEAINQKNDDIAHYNLARIYYFGIDIDKNIPKAIELLERISKKSSDFVFVFLFFIYSFGDDMYKDSQKASLCEGKINKFFGLKYHFSFLLNDVLNLFNKKRSSENNKKQIFQFLKDNDLDHANESLYFITFFYFMLNEKPPSKLENIMKDMTQKDITSHFYDGFYSD